MESIRTLAMAQLGSYPKVFALGHHAVAGLLDHDVFVEEKVDGSQFSFGLGVQGHLHMRSKGAVIHEGNVPKMFALAVETVQARRDLLVEGWTYRAEAVTSKKHNVLMYDRIPPGGLVVFDIEGHGDEEYLPRAAMEREVQKLGLFFVPFMWGPGRLTHETFEELLETESFLGGPKVEGVVIKAAGRNVFGVDKKPLVAKFVSEAFKETHAKQWGASASNKPHRGTLAAITATLRHERRWEKAIEAMRDAGELQHAPQDIGPLMRRVQEDVKVEEREWIKEKLYETFREEIVKGVALGLPEWYKQRLAASAFTESDA